MSETDRLLEQNRAWAERKRAAEPGFFQKLAQQQSPKFLWIGCSDSRVPANEITGLAPGEVFVHRNVANLVVHTDLNCLSVLHFAVELLQVRHIIVCGHYGCAGVRAAIARQKVGLAESWLHHVQDVQSKYTAELAAIADPVRRERRLCELNVLEQMDHVCASSVVQEAWTRHQPLSVHAWIYGLEDGLLRDLGVSRSGVAK